VLLEINDLVFYKVQEEFFIEFFSGFIIETTVICTIVMKTRYSSSLKLRVTLPMSYNHNLSYFIVIIMIKSIYPVFTCSQSYLLLPAVCLRMFVMVFAADTKNPTPDSGMQFFISSQQQDFYPWSTRDLQENYS